MEAPSLRQWFPNTGVSIDSEVEACWNLAAWIGQQSSDDHLCSFTSLLIALLHSDAPLSKWFLRYARAADITLERIYESSKFRPANIQLIKVSRSKGEVPTGKPDWTESVKNIATEAIKLMNNDNSQGNSQLGIRHLLGAYFYRLTSDHQKQLIEWGFDLQREASALVRQIRDRYPVEIEQWTRIHTSHFKTEPDLKSTDPILSSRISGFAADTPEGEDQLNIEDDVYALSALVCSTRVSPPLSVGLFGDWGSGKSFFIRRLQKGVSWISQQARQSALMQKEVPFYKHVVQIEFNAWNYSEGNLWAALVQHILENLRLSDDPKDKDLVAARRAHLQKQMELEQQVRAAATKKQNQAQKRVDDTTDKLQKLRDLHEEQVNKLKEVMATDVLQTMKLDAGTEDQINNLCEELGLEKVTGNAGEFVGALESIRSVLRRTSAVFEYVPAKQRCLFFFKSALVLFVPPVVAIVVGLVDYGSNSAVAPVASFAGWLSTTLAAGTAWLRDRTNHLNARVAQIEKLQQHAQQRVDAELQTHKAEAAELEQRIALAKDEILAAQVRQQEAVSRLDQIKAQLAATTPASVLADFVRERSQSEDYRKYLGLPAVIRRDFESISRMVAQENAELEEKTSLGEENANSDHRINRIVLYIDDLDRCSEQLVVEVLQAVHLLLAFPLFVVFVAVDARWVSQSLERRFPGLLAAAKNANASEPGAEAPGNATSKDYLEKIFQIPFWLRQPTEESVKRMLNGLIKESLTDDANNNEPDDSGKRPEMVEKKAQRDELFKGRRHDPNARALDIQPQEQQYIVSLAPLLDRSPRALKRFVNVYRLMKASLSPEEQDIFLEEDGPLGAPFKSVLLLLAIVNGLPSLSEVLLQSLLSPPARSQDTSAKPASLGTFIADDSNWSQIARDETAHLMAWLDSKVGVDWKTADPARFLQWVPRVARYTYHLHRVAAH